MLKIKTSALENMYTIPNFLLTAFLLLLIVYTLRQIRKWLTVFKVKKKAEKLYSEKFRIKLSILPVLSSVVYLFSQNGTKSINLVFVKHKYQKYHFDSASRIEIYVGNRETYKTGKLRFSIGKRVTWKLKGSLALHISENKEITVIFNRPPMDITSSCAKAPEYLGNGDIIFDDITIYSLKYFSKMNKG